MAQDNRPWWQKGAAAIGKGIYNNVGLDDASRAYKHAKAGDWGKALGSAGIGLLEAGLTVLPGTAALRAGRGLLPAAAALGKGLAVTGGMGAAGTALERMARPTMVSAQPPMRRSVPAGFTTADRYESSLARQQANTAGAAGRAAPKPATPVQKVTKPAVVRQPAATAPAAGGVATGAASPTDAGQAPTPGLGSIGGVGSADSISSAVASGLMGPDAAAQAAYEAALANAQRALGGTQNQLSQYRLQGELSDAAAERAARGRYMGSLVDAEQAAAENLMSSSPAGLGLAQASLGDYLASQLGGISQGATQRAGDMRTQSEAAQSAYESAMEEAKLARLQNQVGRTRQRSLDWLNLGGML